MRHQRPGQHIPRKGGPSTQLQHGQGIKKQHLPRNEAMCPGSQGRQAGKGQKFGRLCTHVCHLSPENCGEGPDSEALRCWLPQTLPSLSFFQHHTPPLPAPTSHFWPVAAAHPRRSKNPRPTTLLPASPGPLPHPWPEQGLPSSFKSYIWSFFLQGFISLFLQTLMAGKGQH